MSRIHEYLPETLKDVIDLKLLNEDLDIELEQLDGYITGIGKEVIVKSASLYGIEKWEKALGITPKDGDSLETRRFRVNNLLTSKLPYTYRWLIKKLTQITGSPSGYTLNINQNDYAITIVLSGLDTNMMIEVQKQLRNAIPSNMVLEIGGPPLVSADIKVGMALRIGTKYKIPSGYGKGGSSIPLGKNIFNINSIPFRVGSGTKYSINNNTINISGDWFIAYKINVQKNTDYYISAIRERIKGNSAGNISIYDGNVKKMINAGGLNNFTFNTGDHEQINIVLYCGQGPTNSGEVNFTNIQLEKGTKGTEYEPFIGL